MPNTVDLPAKSGSQTWMNASPIVVGMTLAILGTFLFAIKSVLIKLAYGVGATSMDVLVLRMLMAFPFYVGVFVYDFRSTSQTTMTWKQVVAALLLGFLGYYLASLLDLRGLEYISAQLERLTLFTYPAMIAVLAWVFLREQLTIKIVISILLCYVGIFLMYARESTFTNAVDVRRGVAFVVGSAVSYSCYVVFAKGLMQKIGSRRFTSLAMIGSTFFVVIHFVSTQTFESFGPSPRVWGYCAVLAVMCTVIPSYLVNEAIVRIGATRTTVIGTVGPVVTMLLAIVVLKEPTSIQHIVGMLVVLLGVTLVTQSTSKSKQ